MGSVSIADAKAHLSELVERAAGGEAVQITRRGKPIAQIVAAKAPRKRIDSAALRAMVDKMPMPIPAASGCHCRWPRPSMEP